MLVTMLASFSVIALITKSFCYGGWINNKDGLSTVVAYVLHNLYKDQA